MNVNDIAQALQALLALSGSPASVDTDGMTGTPPPPTTPPKVAAAGNDDAEWDKLLADAARSATPTRHDVREKAQGKRCTWTGGLHVNSRSVACSLEIRSDDRVAVGKLIGWCKLAKLRVKELADGKGFYVKPRDIGDVGAMTRLVLLAPGLDGVEEAAALRMAEGIEIAYKMAIEMRPDSGELAARERQAQEVAANFLTEMAKRRG